MILRQTADGPIAIRQQDHASFAAFMLEHWSDHAFPIDPERGKIIAATRHHDDGWNEVDDGPTLEPETGLPLAFDAVNPETASSIWRRGIESRLQHDQWQALMITHHAYSVNELGHKRDTLWKAFFTEFAQQRALLRNQLGLTHPEVERAYSYLRMADWFSLQFCMAESIGQARPETYGGYSYTSNGTEFRFRPYPFDERDLVFELPFMRLKLSGYHSVVELRRDMARRETLGVVLNPLPGKRR